jgi:SpoVK/Ycf46/Vps4 family AAA+-type ATPase
MILDSAWHLTDALYPARQAEYTYKTRPFWWWHIYKDLDQRNNTFRDQFVSLAVSLDNQFNYAEHLDCPLPHAFADLPIDTFVALQGVIARDLATPAPASFDSKVSKRPITILSLSGYGGSAISESIASHVAFGEGADLVQVDSYDLSMLVGDYLGQNWAYSRGSVSMIGFRAAELNGKLVTDAESPSRTTGDDDDADSDNILSLRAAAAGRLEEDLQKIRQGGFDCFSKWENLKIDKILDHIIKSTEAKDPAASASGRPVLIHVHDLVEMSMTLEGSILLNRLRSLVDATWQSGRRIAILGTSSCETPSDEYQSAIKDLAYSDFLITRHLQPDRADTKKTSSKIQTRSPFSLQKADYFFENVENINRMMEALYPGKMPATSGWMSEAVSTYLRSGNHRFSMLRDAILPIPEVYHLARAVKSMETSYEGSGHAGFMERFALGPLRQEPGQQFLDIDEGETKQPNGESSTGDETKTENRAPMKLNEYEKRISSGQINKENLRTTFDDVHVPKETISALKLLTSLALVRPDAFSYGVLAADKIPGCLLYGPPGTGKTMLAKAVAKESGANMLEISGATINDKWVGESEKLIRAVFTLAKKLSPCVVFIDEADSLLANRSMFSNRPSHREHINQFLKEWDGMEETNAFIMVATNRPFDLDDAVLRRLPRKLLVDLPLKDDREAILKLLLRGETSDSSVSVEEYAKRTPYYSGSDLKNVCVAAAMAAVEEENEAAAKHTGPEPFQYPEKRVLRHDHFESAMKQIPASISEDMASLKMIRKFDEEYGNRRRNSKKSSMGFGVVDEKVLADSTEARIRP